MELKPGYKRTEVGVIPEDWGVRSIGEIASISVGRDVNESCFSSEPHDAYLYPVFSNTVANFGLYGYYNFPEYQGEALTVVGRGVGLGTAFARSGGFGAIGRLLVLHPTDKASAGYLTEYINQRVKIFSESGGIPQLTGQSLSKYKVPIPCTKNEQDRIATVLSHVDTLLSSLDKLIAKKRDIKQATMQQLLTGKQRLPGFSGEWAERTLFDSADCLDNLRIPLNEKQRATMQGDYPYCGANGVLDFVNDFVIDDDIILMAEDGGYFDEYQTRPIAYRMKGKCWVNNHAHILKSKKGFDQGFLFYSLVHKNIIAYLASGTRAKLNKSELFKIEVAFPNDEAEQFAIASVLSDMDAEISALEQKRNKTRALKQGMMQELLTGRIRLI